MTHSARGNVEASLERWIEDSVGVHADSAGDMLSKAERWTATAVATLKREQQGFNKVTTSVPVIYTLVSHDRAPVAGVVDTAPPVPIAEHQEETEDGARANGASAV